MAESNSTVLTATQKINIRSASIGNYYDRNKKRITQAGIKFLDLSETAKQRDDWKGRLELWKQDTLSIANESVDKLQIQLHQLGNETFQIDSHDSTRNMEIAHPYMVNIKKLIESIDDVMCQIQLQWVSGMVDDFIYEQASNQSINALNKVISRFVYLSDESAKRNRGLFSQHTFERMISKDLRALVAEKKVEAEKSVKNVSEDNPSKSDKEKASESKVNGDVQSDTGEGSKKEAKEKKVA